MFLPAASSRFDHFLVLRSLIIRAQIVCFERLQTQLQRNEIDHSLH